MVIEKLIRTHIISSLRNIKTQNYSEVANRRPSLWCVHVSSINLQGVLLLSFAVLKKKAQGREGFQTLLDMGDPDKPVANGQAGQASQNKTPLQVEAKKFEEIVFCSRKYRTLIENKFH